jgi:hypothetical protein
VLRWNCAAATAGECKEWPCSQLPTAIHREYGHFPLGRDTESQRVDSQGVASKAGDGRLVWP